MSDLAWLVLALVCFYLLLWWQHTRDWKEDRAIAAWIAPGLSWLGDRLFRFYDAIVSWCWGWEKQGADEREIGVTERTELQRLREMYGMVRGAEEKVQTPEEIRTELAKLRDLFDMKKEAGE